MDTIYSLLKRAKELKNKSQVDSITPEEVGKLHEDTLAYIALLEQSTDGLGIKKVYLSKSAMEADTDPVGTNGKALRYGQLVSIYDDAHADSSENGNIYAYQKPGWLLMGKISNKVTIVQELGDSKEKVMSQAAVSSLLPTYDASKDGQKYNSIEECLVAVNALPDERKRFIKQIIFSSSDGEVKIFNRIADNWTSDAMQWVENGGGGVKVKKKDFSFEDNKSFYYGAIGSETEMRDIQNLSVSAPVQVNKGDKLTFVVVDPAIIPSIVELRNVDGKEVLSVLTFIGEGYGKKKQTYTFTESAKVRFVTPSDRISEAVLDSSVIESLNTQIGQLDSEIKDLDEQIASYYTFESSSVNKDHIGSYMTEANKWRAFTHENRNIDGIYVTANASTILHIGKIDISKKPFVAVELFTKNIVKGVNTIFFDERVVLEETEYLSIKTDESVLRSSDVKNNACFGVITEGSSAVTNEFYNCPQYSIIVNRTKSYEDIISLCEEKSKKASQELKLRKLDLKFFDRTAEYSIRTKYISVPARTRKLPVDLSGFAKEHSDFFSFSLLLFDKNKNKIAALSEGNNNYWKEVVDISQYPKTAYYKLIAEGDSVRGYLFYDNATLKLPISDADYIQLGLVEQQRLLSKEDKKRIVYAVCKNLDGFGTKNFGFLHISDVHNAVHQEVLAAKIVNEDSNIDAIINTGDSVGVTFEQSRVLSQSIIQGLHICNKPVYMVIGNHDKGNTYNVANGASVKDLYDVFIRPLYDRGDLLEGEYVENECYYYHDFNEKGVRLIVLNQYDNDDLEESDYWEPVQYQESYPKIEFNHTYTHSPAAPTFVNCGNYTKFSFRLKKTVTTGAYSTYGKSENMPAFKIHSGGITYSERQLNWFCETLKSTPANYKVLLAIHSPVGDNMVIQNSKFSYYPGPQRAGEENQNCVETEIIQLILKAFNEKKQLNQNVKYKDKDGTNNGMAYYLNTQVDFDGRKYAFNISCDFSASSNAMFVCMIGGHIHHDCIYRDPAFGFNSIHCLSPLNGSAQGGFARDYDFNMSADFAFNIIGFGKSKDMSSREVRIARVGNDINEDGVVYDVLKI